MDSIEQWFAQQGWQPFAFQREVWQAYLDNRSGLIHAPTGTGKTYAAWLGPLAEALAAPERSAAPGLRVLWITPLRALVADTQVALRAPLDALGLPWTVESRTGDTAPSARRRQRQRLPEALITTPESLSLLLSQPDAPQAFAGLRLVVVDEWHELLSSKRGTQTELALARLRTFAPALRTWGLSATIGNLAEALAALVGARACGSLIQGQLDKSIQIDALIPQPIERFPWAGHLGLRQLPQVLQTIEASRTTLVFTNTRAQSELWFQAILEARPDWAGEVALHHSAIERESRAWVEAALREGRVRCVVCTSSLDLGVDFAPVDTVLQIGSPKGVARLIQRAGRSGHQPGRASRAVCVPTNAFELVEIAAARDAVLAGRIEPRQPYRAPLDVLVQHIVTCAAGGGFRAEQLLAEVRSCYVYRDLTDAQFAWALEFAAHGGAALRAYPEYARLIEQDGVYTVASERVAKRHRLTIGTIVSEASVRVRYQRGGDIGQVEESFIARLKPGDRFLLAGKTLEFLRMREMVAQVRRAAGRDAAVPRWQGSRLPFSSELAAGVLARLAEARAGEFRDAELQALIPILRIQQRWSAIPVPGELLVERLRTREGYHLFVYPFAGRLAHEGLAALLAYRLTQRRPLSFAIAPNDYGFELLSDQDPLADAAAPAELLRELLSPCDLDIDIIHSLNAAELARRQFREIARVAGLVTEGYPGEKSTRQIQASAGLLYDVFVQYDPDNLLLAQARTEVLERQLERSRIAVTLAWIAAGTITVTTPPRPTPFGFPLLVERLRASVSSETLADRVAKMELALERDADR